MNRDTTDFRAQKRPLTGRNWALNQNCGAAKRFLAAFAVVGAVSATTPLADAGSPSVAPGCDVFPADNQWNARVDALPVLGNSDDLVASVGASIPLHPDFGAGRYDGAKIGIPYKIVSRSQPNVEIKYDEYGSQSDPGPFPIPPGVPVEGAPHSSGDRHVIVIDRYACRLYELYHARARSDGSWKAGSGATWNLDSNDVRHAGWTSADAAGLPIFPGLTRYGEVKAGEINHALRFTVPESRSGDYVYPARHFASDDPSHNLPRMGERFRLKASVDIADYPRQARVILKALKRYGMIVADNGSPWYLSGAPSSNWSNSKLHELGGIKGRDFEAVDTSSLPRPR